MVFFMLLSCSVTASVVSYERQLGYIQRDVDNALSETMQQQASDYACADTIRCFRKHIATPEVRDTAYIVVRTVNRGETEHTVLQANAGCSFATVFSLSDQRLSGLLAALALLWMLLTWRIPHKAEAGEVAAVGTAPLTLIASEHVFVSAEGERLHLTPLQQQLMELLQASPSHSLSKQEICNALWPGKPDGSETLYTLVRRLKPTLERHNLTLVSERGKGYSLRPV
jgi:hypothetical protein